MAIAEIQTVLDASQFTATPGAGFWSFQRYNNLPRTTDIQIDGMAYNEDANGMGIITTAIAFLPFLLGTPDTARMIWARDDAQFGDLLNPISGNAAKTFRGYRLPREAGDNGKWWDMYFATLDKENTASAIITWYLIAAQPGT
jgi:hypothetical protein